MGGKQRWTPDEENALRDGVERYGPGKWRTIQKDPEFTARLAARSNVDLKDKWRNLTADPSQKAAAKHRAAHGTSKRGRAKQRGSAAARQGAELQRGVSAPRRIRASAMEADAAAERDAAATLMGAGGAGPSRPRANGRAPSRGPKPEDMIIAAIISLGEPGGSHPDDVQDWIEQSQYRVEPDFRRVLAPTLQHMVETGRLDSDDGASPGKHCCCYRLATLKYAPQHSGDAGASEGGASMLSSGDMRGAFDQTALEAAQQAAAAVAEAAEAAARADRLGDAAALFELAARQAEAESPTAGGNGGGWSIRQPKREDDPG